MLRLERVEPVDLILAITDRQRRFRVEAVGGHGESPGSRRPRPRTDRDGSGLRWNLGVCHFVARPRLRRLRSALLSLRLLRPARVALPPRLSPRALSVVRTCPPVARLASRAMTNQMPPISA